MEQRLTKIKGFLPYITIVFLNAMTDLGHKIVIQNTVFKCYDGPLQILLTAIVNALILLPFIFMFSPAGYIGDKYPKHKVIIIAAGAAIPLTILITICYHFGWFEIAFILTLLLALQSAFYSPAKYGYIKELTGKENIAKANAAVQSVTIIAILAGAVLYSLLFEKLLKNATTTPSDILKHLPIIGYLLIFGATVETVLAFLLPKKSETNKSMNFKIKKYVTGKYLKDNMKILLKKDVIWLSIIALSIFWAVNQVVFATFGAFLKETLNENNTVIAQGLLSIGGIGIIFGSVIAGKFSKNYIETGLIPVGIIGMGLTLYIIPSLSSIPGFGILLFFYGLSGGMLIVPLNSLIQFNAKNTELGKVLAGNNFIQNILMLAFLIITILSAKLGFSGKSLLYAMAFVVFIGAIYTIKKIPQSLVRYITRLLLAKGYSIDVQGLNNIPSTQGTLLLGNHSSWIDWAILQIACPRKIRFVMERSIYEKWYLKSFLNFFNVVPISKGKSKLALMEITNGLNNGDVIALFPEGTITRTGQLCYFHTGFERAAEGTNSVIVPFYINGLWGSFFSFAGNVIKKTLKTGSSRVITVSFGNQMNSNSTTSEVKEAVQKLSVKGWNNYKKHLQPVHISWLKAAKSSLSSTSVTDSNKHKLNNRELLAKCLTFSRKIAFKTRKFKKIAIVLPNSINGIVTNLAVLMRGKVAVNIKGEQEIDSFKKQLKAAGAKIIITSKKELEKIGNNYKETADFINNENLILVDEVFNKVNILDKFVNFLYIQILPVFLLKLFFFKHKPLSNTAVILFSSGKSGKTKKVEYTHSSLMTAIYQMSSVFNITEDDVVLSTLPLYHSAGLLITTLMPLINGIPFAIHDKIDDSNKIGKLAAINNCTFLFTTPKALSHFVNFKKLHPLMFSSLRFVATGFEKLDLNLASDFKEKFGLDIYQGYGISELSPVITVNVPDRIVPGYWFAQIGNKKGTVGQAVPGNTIKIVDPQTGKQLPFNQEGQIQIASPISLKQQNLEKSCIITDETEICWYKTDDLGQLDEDGFLTITGKI